MTPAREKAVEIVIKMQFQEQPLMIEQAKICAISAVSLVLQLNCLEQRSKKQIAHDWKAYYSSYVEYLEDIKQEILKI